MLKPASGGSALTIVGSILASLYMSVYWLLGLFSAEPLSVVAIYRYKDFQYYPLMGALADFNLGEAAILEHHGENLSSFPFVGLLPHALLFRVLGPLGMAVGDALICLLFFLGVNYLLKAVTIRSPLRQILALAILCSPQLDHLPEAIGIQSSWEFWGLRYPRPFVSTVFVLLCLWFLVRLFIDRDWKSVRRWALFGLSFAAVLQSDIYPTVTISMLALTGWISLWLRRRPSDGWPLVMRGAIFAGVAAAGSVPFALQRWMEHPDVPLRLGAFPVDRLSPPVFWPDIVIPLAICLWGGLLGYWLVSHPPGHDFVRPRVVWGGMVVCVTASLAMPVFGIVVGKLIQTYHFRSSLKMFCCYVGLIYLVYTAEILWAPLEAGAWALAKPVKATLLALLSVAVLLVAHNRHEQQMEYPGYPRRWVLEFRSLESYRSDFNSLVQQLTGERYRGSKVLATFDNTLYSWWTTFRGGHVFSPDPFHTTMPDAVIESRLARMCALLAMTETDFREFVSRNYVSNLFLSNCKYQASIAHTFAPLSEYTESQRRAIAQTNVLSSWHRIIPASELDRLARVFTETRIRPLEPARLDLIILTNDESLRPFQPPPDEFELTYSNPTFRVFQRNPSHRTTAGCPHLDTISGRRGEARPWRITGTFRIPWVR